MSFKSRDLLVTMWESGQADRTAPSCGTTTTDCQSRPPCPRPSERKAADTRLALLRQQLRESLGSVAR